MKAKGRIFDRWYFCDYRHQEFNFDFNSDKMLDESMGDKMLLSEFIESCEANCFIDYDGHAREIVLDGKIIWDKTIAPSDCLFWKNKLLELNEQCGNKLEIVWYNK